MVGVPEKEECGWVIWWRNALQSSRRLFQKEPNTGAVKHLLMVETSAEYWPEFVICVLLPWGFRHLVSFLWTSFLFWAGKGVCMMVRYWKPEYLTWVALLMSSDWWCLADTCFLATVGQKGPVQSSLQLTWFKSPRLNYFLPQTHVGTSRWGG